MIKIEHSRDEGKTWETWSFYDDDNVRHAGECLARLKRLHCSEFRLRVTEAGEDDVDVRKLRAIQRRPV